MQFNMFDDPDTLLYEHDDGTVSEVDCKDPGLDDTTRLDDHVEGGDACWYHYKSALHKAVRTPNLPRALAFAHRLDEIKSNTTRSYLRKITFEETRNLDLIRSFYNKDSVTEFVTKFCRSKKDWEISDDRGIFSPMWYNALIPHGWCATDLESDITYDWPSDLESTIHRWAKSDHEKLYELVACMTCWTPSAKEKVKKGREVLVNIAYDIVDPRWQDEVSRLSARYHNEELLFLWHIITGDYDAGEHVSYTHEVDRNTRIDVPVLEDYIYDVHTRSGRKRIHSSQDEMGWGEPMPDGIDLRWSGAEAGTLWRYLAHQQHGTTDVPWEDVECPGWLAADWREFAAFW